MVKNNLVKILVVLSIVLTNTLTSVGVSALALPATHPAFATQSQSDACNGLGAFGDQTCTTNVCQDGQTKNCTQSAAQGTLNTTVGNIVNILSFIIGVIAAIMIVISGARFMTAGGDSSKIAAAKTGLIYAIIGIVIIALAQFIVHVVMTNTPSPT